MLFRSAILTDTDILFDLFCKAHREKFGDEYPANFGKDKKILKDLAKLYGLEKVKGFMHRFFTEDNDWVREKGYTIGIFKSQIPKFISGKYGGIGGIVVDEFKKEKELQDPYYRPKEPEITEEERQENIKKTKELVNYLSQKEGA